MPLRDSPAPSSRREPFPLVMNSAVVQTFVDRLARSAHPARVVPLFLGRNSLELQGLIRHIMIRLGISDIECQPQSGRQSFMNLMDDQPELLVYPKGEQIPPHVQASMAGDLFKHTRIIACLTKPLDGSPWQKDFVKIAMPPMHFPAYAERADDRRDLVIEVYRRLTMPHGRKRPALADDAMTALLAMPFEGTDDLEDRIKSAWNHYIGSHARGPLTEKLILGSQARRALESRGDLPSS